MKKKTKKLKCDSGRNAAERSGANAKAWKRNNAFAPPSPRCAVATAIAVVIISVLTIFTIVKAGNITPPNGVPVAQFYTLTEIYQFITSNTAATEGGHDFTFSDALSSTHRTLTEIYDALASLISADKVKLGTTYLAVAGTLVPSGGTAAASDVLSGKTFFGDSQSDWNLKTGAMPDNSGHADFAPAAANVSIPIGFYDGITEILGDADLISSNIKSGVNIFGADGSLITNPVYGDNDPAQVLNTAANPGAYDANTCTTNYNTTNLSAGTVKSDTLFGDSLTGDYPSAAYPLPGDTGAADAAASGILNGLEAWTKAGSLLTGAYNVTNLSNNVIKQGTTWGESLGQTRTLTPDGGTAGVGDLFNGKTANLTNDWNLDTGTLNLACNTATFNGTLNLAADGYDGAGSGNNRWCMTDSGDATAGEMKTGKIGWVDGQAVTGTGTQTLSASSEAVAAGYYEATTLSTIDSDLAAGNILSGTTIFGIAGTVSAGYPYGDNIQATVLTTAASAGTYNASNLSTATVKKGTTFGVSSTGAYSGYPGTGWTGGTTITQAACDAQNGSGWYWFEDGNGDGDATDPEDGICVKTTTVTAASWNGYDWSTNYDNTYIAAYTCSGSFPSGTVATYSGIDSSGNPDTTWNDGDCALCQADCYDGVKDLPGQGGYTSSPGGSTGYSGPITPEVLKEWKGTRLPTSSDFFGFCGATDGDSDATAGDSLYHSSGASADVTIGNYGKNVGRGTGSEYMDLSNSGNYEWLSGSAAPFTRG